MTTPTLSISVHGRNDGYHQTFLWRLETCLNRHGLNLAAQPDGFGEIVLCDWGSPQDAKLIDNLNLNQECRDRLRYVYVSPELARARDRDSPYSSSHAINTSARRCRGRYLMICDSDVYVTATALAAVAAALASGDTLNDHVVTGSFFWAARYHIPVTVTGTSPPPAALEAHIAAHNQTFVSDTPRDQFRGAVCALVLPREIWWACGGFDERLIYWGVNDIDIHQRLLWRCAFGGILDSRELRFYHLEHYQTRELNNREHTVRRHNEYLAPTVLNPNGPDWGLGDLNLEVPLEKTPDLADYMLTQVGTMADLAAAVLADPAPPYDWRLLGIMTATQYAAYQDNRGHMYYLYLTKLVKRLRPRRVLELGTSIGRSAAFLMLTLPADSTLTTVDIGSYLRVDLANFSADDRLLIVFGDDLDAGVRRAIGIGFDLLFIDSKHTFEQVSAEWRLYAPALLDGAVVVLDDIHLNQGMERFWTELPYDKVDLGVDLHFSGFGMFRYKRLP